MNVIQPTLDYRLATARQAELRGDAARMRVVTRARREATDPEHPALRFSHRATVAAAAILVTITAAAATALAL